MKSNDYYKFMDLMNTIDESNTFPLKQTILTGLAAGSIFKIRKQSMVLERLRRKYDLQVTEIMKQYDLLEVDTRDKMHSVWEQAVKDSTEFHVIELLNFNDNMCREYLWDYYRETVFQMVAEIAENKLSLEKEKK